MCITPDARAIQIVLQVILLARAHANFAQQSLGVNSTLRSRLACRGLKVLGQQPFSRRDEAYANIACWEVLPAPCGR